jgi:transposase
MKFEQAAGNIQINTRRGKPRNKPREALDDTAYDTESIRSYLRRRGIRSNIPSNKRNRKKPKKGRPTRFQDDSYKKQGAVERFFGWIKLGFRRIAVRHERLGVCFDGLIRLASFLIIWRKIWF